MAEFSTDRLTDDSPISRVDNALASAEGAHADIFGIPKDQTITNSIFGGVDLNARITGDRGGSGNVPSTVPTIYNQDSTESIAAAIDFHSVDGGNDIGWRIVPIGGELRIYEREPADENAGTLIQNLALPRLFTNLDDCGIADLESYAGNILAIDDNPPYNIVSIEPSAGTGANNFYELNDTPTNYGGVVDGMVVVAADGATPGVVDHLEFRAGAGDVSMFIDLDDTFDEYDGKAQGLICVADDETGLVASFYTYSRAKNTNNQSVLSTQEYASIDWGSVLDDFPSGANIIQGTGIVFPQELDRDCVYQLNYWLRYTHNSIAYNTVAVSLLAGGTLDCDHENIYQASLNAGPDYPPRTLNGSFMVRVPKGSSAAGTRTLYVRHGRITFVDDGTWEYTTSTYSGSRMDLATCHIEVCRIN
jgi:hypothetical protein